VNEMSSVLFLSFPALAFLNFGLFQIFIFSFLLIINFCISVSAQADKPSRHFRYCDMDEATPFNVVAFDVCNLAVLNQEFSCDLAHQPSHVTRVRTLPSTNRPSRFIVFIFHPNSIPFISSPPKFPAYRPSPGSDAISLHPRAPLPRQTRSLSISFLSHPIQVAYTGHCL
jgi:hypothetical protein